MGTKAACNQQDVDRDVVEASLGDELRHDDTEGSRTLLQGLDQLMLLDLVLAELLSVHDTHAVHAVVQLVTECKQYNQCCCVSCISDSRYMYSR